MRLRPDQLTQQLQKQLLPIYVVSGDEPLLVQEACDQIRRYAREQGCSEREVIDASPKNFDWQEILGSATSMSLFCERKLVEIRLPSGKPGAAGSKALCAYVEMAGPDDILLLIAGKIDKQSMNSKWIKTLDKTGAIIQVWPISAKDLPRWLQQRIAGAGMSIDNDALQLLSDRVEGNLLAAVQELEKLKLLSNDSHITAQAVIEAVSDNARYNLFEMVDSALGGDACSSLRMLHGLRGEGTEAAVVMWALTREIHTLQLVQADCNKGQNIQQALRSQRVWNNRMQLMQSASTRHNARSLANILKLATVADGSIKGFADGKPWDNLESLILELAMPPKAVAQSPG
jgi:DNA polymerase-3 subunit delta